MHQSGNELSLDLHINESSKWNSSLLYFSICFSDRSIIEFRNATNLKKLIYSHSVAPHDPVAMCTVTPSTLLYLDSKSTHTVHWLDLSESQPQIAAGKSEIHTINTKNFYNIDMCFVQDGDKQLLVIANSSEGLFAYNTVTGKLEWKKKRSEIKGPMCICGATTDGRGNLFVTDESAPCILMFSVTDGQYLGRLFKDVKSFTNPQGISWCEEISSLLVLAVDENFEKHVNVISVKYWCLTTYCSLLCVTERTRSWLECTRVQKVKKDPWSSKRHWKPGNRPPRPPY